YTVAFSPDGRRLASGGRDRTIRVRSAPSGEELFTLSRHAAAVSQVVFSPDGGRLASASGDRTVRIWDAITGKETIVFAGHPDIVHCVAFHPEGRQLASGGKGADDVRFWELPFRTAPAVLPAAIETHFPKVLEIARPDDLPAVLRRHGGTVPILDLAPCLGLAPSRLQKHLLVVETSGGR